MKTQNEQKSIMGKIDHPHTRSPLHPHISTFLHLYMLLMVLVLAACAPNLLNPPREATTTALAAGTVPSPTAEPLTVPAPTPTGEPLLQGTAPAGSTDSTKPTLTLWVNKTTPAHEAALQTMVAEFSAEHAINVDYLLVQPDLLPDLVSTAAVSPSLPLPDMMLLPLEYVVGWTETGILDAAAADAVVEELGRDTFDAAALDMVTVGGETVAIPSHGWQQLIVYRSDWFVEDGLAPPTDFDAMVTAGEVISDRLELNYSFNMPTESFLRPTTQVFEHMALANGCQIVDDKGELLILEPVCEDSLAFYRFFCNTFCPPGVQTEVSTANAYLSGRVGMIIAAPHILPRLAGLDDDYPPTCPDCTTPAFLAQNSGFVTTLTGRGPNATAANFSEITYLGITGVADEEAAATFARYWFDEGYLTWLGVEPELSVPMRSGTPGAPTRFLDAWYDLPLRPGSGTIGDIFGEETATLLAGNLVNPNRWGFAQGQGALITGIYEELTLSSLLQELLSGYYDSERAAIEGYKRLVELIPNYQYYVDPEPTETPES